MDSMLVEYIERNIAQIDDSEAKFNYSYCCGMLGGLFVVNQITLDEYNNYGARVYSTYMKANAIEKPNEETT